VHYKTQENNGQQTAQCAIHIAVVPSVHQFNKDRRIGEKSLYFIFGNIIIIKYSISIANIDKLYLM